MSRSIRAIGDSRVGNPPVGWKSRLRSAARARDSRRDALPAGPAPGRTPRGHAPAAPRVRQALAAPSGCPARPAKASNALSTPPRVASDAGGNSVAVWLGAGGGVNAAFRPRGGPWSAAENLETEFVVTSGVAPRVVAMPNGEFVAAWLADRNNDGDDVIRSARRARRAALGARRTSSPRSAVARASRRSRRVATAASPWSGRPRASRPPTRGRPGGPGARASSCPPGPAASSTPRPTGPSSRSLTGTCSGETSCIEAAYRPPGGPWDADHRSPRA